MVQKYCCIGSKQGHDLRENMSTLYHFVFYNFTNKAGTTGPFQVIGGPSLSTSTDKTEFVDLAPKYYGGITNNISYNGFSLSFSFRLWNEK